MSAFGVSADLGRRPSQQDAAIAIRTVIKDEASSVFGVFDGHGSDGEKCANFCKDSVADVLKKYCDFEQPVEWFTAAFSELHRSLISDESVDSFMSGAVSSIMVHTRNRVIVGGVGDAKVVLARRNDNDNFVAEQLTKDHNCNDVEELNRIKQHGARVERNEENGPLRIFKGTMPYPGIVVTRALGDSVVTKLGVLFTPDVIVRDLTAADAFVILASDGVWDAFSDIQDVVDFVAPYYRRYQEEPEEDGGTTPASQNPTARQASVDLTQASLEGLDRLQIDDNITNIVVFL
jgi:serine/threonine protein phosphatase PrpC